MNPELKTCLAALASDVDRELDALLPTAATPPAAIHEAMRYSIFAGGKRIRPSLCLLVAGAESVHLGTSREVVVRSALPAACALEMIHTYSLIHDDLPCMDDDDLRRGKPTCHKVFGVAMAVLAGDALNTLAFEILTASGDPESRVLQVQELARCAGTMGMVGGQVADLTANREEWTEEGLKEIHERKTAALFAASTAMGAIAAGGSEERIGLWRSVGKRLGLAFQITDDVLDVTASVDEMGKRTQKDASAGKLTYPGLLGLQESRRRAATHLDAARREIGETGDPEGRLCAFLDYLGSRAS